VLPRGAIVARIVGSAHRLVDAGDERLDKRTFTDDAKSRWLDHGQRANGIRMARCRKERDHSTVGVADEMCAVTEHVRDIVGVAVEVDRSVGWTAAEPAPIDEQQAIRIRKWPLVRPGLLTPAKAAVDEDCGLAFAPSGHVQSRCGAHPPSLTAGRPT
jgi:hypothetical protein